MNYFNFSKNPVVILDFLFCKLWIFLCAREEFILQILNFLSEFNLILLEDFIVQIYRYI